MCVSGFRELCQGNMNKKIINISLGPKNKILPNGFFVVVLVFVLFSFCGPSLANNEDYTVYAKEQAQKAKEIIVPYKLEVDALIKDALARQSQPDIKAFKKEITKIAKTQCPNQYQDDNTTTLSGASAATPILIFVSFSMPKESIKGWIAQAKKSDAAIYIRGLVNNSFKDTAKAVQELVQDQPGGLLIDPTLFKKYSITQVPAVVVTNSDSFDVIYGDVNLDYALERISKAAQRSEQQYISAAIRKLRDKK